MRTFNVLLPLLFLPGSPSFDPPAARTDGVVIIAQIPGSDYCHSQFPKIRADTLFGEHPVLEDPNTSIRIDFYGDCAHRPLGTAEIQTQRDEFNGDLDGSEDDG